MDTHAKKLFWRQTLFFTAIIILAYTVAFVYLGYIPSIERIALLNPKENLWIIPSNYIFSSPISRIWDSLLFVSLAITIIKITAEENKKVKWNSLILGSSGVIWALISGSSGKADILINGIIINLFPMFIIMIIVAFNSNNQKIYAKEGFTFKYLFTVNVLFILGLGLGANIIYGTPYSLLEMIICLIISGSMLLTNFLALKIIKFIFTPLIKWIT